MLEDKVEFFLNSKLNPMTLWKKSTTMTTQGGVVIESSSVNNGTE